MNDALQHAIEVASRNRARSVQYRAKRQEQHKADVAYVQEQHPELAAYLTEMAREFGRAEVNYRVVLKK